MADDILSAAQIRAHELAARRRAEARRLEAQPGVVGRRPGTGARAAIPLESRIVGYLAKYVAFKSANTVLEKSARTAHEIGSAIGAVNSKDLQAALVKLLGEGRIRQAAAERWSARAGKWLPAYYAIRA